LQIAKNIIDFLYLIAISILLFNINNKQSQDNFYYADKIQSNNLNTSFKPFFSIDSNNVKCDDNNINNNNNNFNYSNINNNHYFNNNNNNNKNNNTTILDDNNNNSKNLNILPNKQEITTNQTLTDNFSTNYIQNQPLVKKKEKITKKTKKQKLSPTPPLLDTYYLPTSEFNSYLPIDTSSGLNSLTMAIQNVERGEAKCEIFTEKLKKFESTNKSHLIDFFENFLQFFNENKNFCNEENVFLYFLYFF
jgi:hypothetical protein